MKFRSILDFLVLFWRAKKVWHKPKRARTLIYDRVGSEVLFEYINPEDVEILFLRGESISIYALLKCVFSLKLSRANYASKYISLVQPSVVITFVNNSYDFYTIKKTHPRLVTVFVQNGLSTDFGDIFGHFKNHPANESYEVDYMLTFGTAVGKKYRQYIKGQAIPIGSIKNNLSQPGKEIEAGSLVYISQFRPQPSDPNAPYIFDGITPIFYEEFYEVERKLLAFLSRYCERENLRLRVCGQPQRPSDSLRPAEYQFFNSRIGNSNWEFIPSSSLYASYHVIDSAEYVVFLDSTLGYESLARGKKTGAFTIRGKRLSDASRNYGWPTDLPDNGPFWTNDADEREFERVMTYITNVSDEEWESDRLRYVPDLMEYDSGNTRFLNLMRKLEVPLNPEYQTDFDSA